VDPLYASLICCLIWTKYLDRVSVLKVKALLLLDAEAIVEAFFIIPSVLNKKIGELANTLVLNPPVAALFSKIEDLLFLYVSGNKY
jgi:hypothetical protein